VLASAGGSGTHPRPPDDGWSAAVLERAALWQGDRGRANLLLRHLLAAAGSKPSWR
jgi:hypothetical protein